MVADTIGIGLVELTDGKVKKINEIGDRLLAPFYKDRKMPGDLLKDIPETGPFSREINGNMLQFTKIRQKDGNDILLIQDVTETFSMAKRLKSQEKLALLGKMSAQMAHQIKTPLAVLAGTAQILARELEDNPCLREKAAIVYEEAEGLAQRINEIVRFYAGSTVRPLKADICQILKLIKTRLEGETQTIAVSIECQPDIKACIDPVLLADIIFLLGQNALEPNVRASRILLKAVVNGEDILITVEDNGCGIPEAIYEHIFEPFTGTRQDGLGLGLFLAKDLAERLGATVNLKASTYSGTCFEIRLAQSGLNPDT
jgi:signal transduction histidine kinase